MGVKSDIFNALQTQLQTISWANTVQWKTVKLTSGDFNDYELPVIQFYDAGTSYQHEQSRVKSFTQIYIEIVLKQTTAGVVDQATLFDYCEDVEKAIGAKVNLGIPSMLHMKYLSDMPDLHTIEPYFYARLDFEAIYYKQYT